MCDDRFLGLKVEQWCGTTIVCGGTTAKIVAREMRRTLTVNIERGSKLPPTSNIAGVDIVSEGIITLGHVRNLLHQIALSPDIPFFLGLETGVDARIVREMLSHRSITIVIGTRLNRAYFDPSLPVNLARRVELLTDIAKILREEFRKKITIEYL